MSSRRNGLHITRALSAGMTALLNGTNLMSCVHPDDASDSVHRRRSAISSTYCRGSVPFNADFSISEDRLSDVDDDIGAMLKADVDVVRGGRISLETNETCATVKSVDVGTEMREERLDSGPAEEVATSFIGNVTQSCSRSLSLSAICNNRDSSLIGSTPRKTLDKDDSFKLSDFETSLILSATASARLRRTSSRFAIANTFVENKPIGSDVDWIARLHDPQDGEKVGEVDIDVEDENRQLEDCSSASSYDDAEYIDFLWNNLEQMTSSLLNGNINDDETIPPPSEWRDSYIGEDNTVSPPISVRDLWVDDATIPPPSGWEDGCVAGDIQRSTQCRGSTPELPGYLGIYPENCEHSVTSEAVIQSGAKAPPTYIEMMKGSAIYTETDGYCVASPTGNTQTDKYSASLRTELTQTDRNSVLTRTTDTQSDAYCEPVCNADYLCIPDSHEDPDSDLKIASTDDDVSDTESNTSSETSFEYATRLYKMTGGEWSNRSLPWDATLV